MSKYNLVESGKKESRPNRDKSDLGIFRKDPYQPPSSFRGNVSKPVELLTSEETAELEKLRLGVRIAIKKGYLAKPSRVLYVFEPENPFSFPNAREELVGLRELVHEAWQYMKRVSSDEAQAEEKFRRDCQNAILPEAREYDLRLLGFPPHFI